MITSQGIRQYTASVRPILEKEHQRLRQLLPKEPEFLLTEGKDHLEELSCPVCYDLMTNPRFLECGHTLCQSCLGKSSESCAICRTKRPRVRTTPSTIEKNILDKVKGDCGSCKRQKISLLEWNRHYTQECSGSLCVNAGCNQKIKNQEEHDKDCEHLVVKCLCHQRCNWSGKTKERLKHVLKDCEHYQFADKIKNWRDANKSLINQVSQITTAQAELHKSMAVKIGDYCFKNNLKSPLDQIRDQLVVSHQLPPGMTLVSTIQIGLNCGYFNGELLHFTDCLLVLILRSDQLKDFINNEREALPEFLLYYKRV